MWPTPKMDDMFTKRRTLRRTECPVMIQWCESCSSAKHIHINSVNLQRHVADQLCASWTTKRTGSLIDHRSFEMFSRHNNINMPCAYFSSVIDIQSIFKQLQFINDLLSLSKTLAELDPRWFELTLIPHLNLDIWLACEIVFKNIQSRWIIMFVMRFLVDASVKPDNNYR